MPDWQGLGLIFVILDFLGQLYTAFGFRLRMYPAHVMLVRSFERSESWSRIKRFGVFSSRNGRKSKRRVGAFGGRMNAVYEYVGERGNPKVFSDFANYI